MPTLPIAPTVFVYLSSGVGFWCLKCKINQWCHCLVGCVIIPFNLALGPLPWNSWFRIQKKPKYWVFQTSVIMKIFMWWTTWPILSMGVVPIPSSKNGLHHFEAVKYLFHLVTVVSWSFSWFYQFMRTVVKRLPGLVPWSLLWMMVYQWIAVVAVWLAFWSFFTLFHQVLTGIILGSLMRVVRLFFTLPGLCHAVLFVLYREYARIFIYFLGEKWTIQQLTKKKGISGNIQKFFYIYLLVMTLVSVLWRDPPWYDYFRIS